MSTVARMPMIGCRMSDLLGAITQVLQFLLGWFSDWKVVGRCLNFLAIGQPALTNNHQFRLSGQTFHHLYPDSVINIGSHGNEFRLADIDREDGFLFPSV
jgi:hypothetical protein